MWGVRLYMNVFESMDIHWIRCSKLLDGRRTFRRYSSRKDYTLSLVHIILTVDKEKLPRSQPENRDISRGWGRWEHQLHKYIINKPLEHLQKKDRIIFITAAKETQKCAAPAITVSSPSSSSTTGAVSTAHQEEAVNEILKKNKTHKRASIRIQARKISTIDIYNKLG